MINKPLYICISLFISLVSCQGAHSSDSQQADTVVADGSSSERPIVDTLTLRPKDFSMDVMSNGVVRAAQWADLYFRNSDVVEQVFVHDGQRVGAGQPIAKLDTYKLESEKVKQEAALEQAKLELQDVLISQGYNPDDINRIPTDILQLARVKSGLAQAEANLSTTIRDIEQATLSAPFGGVVANVKAQSHSMAPQSDPVCRIIDNSSMVVEFPVLESELNLIGIGDKVEVSPFAGGGVYAGAVSEINPIVNENGQSVVRATLSDCRLTDGMNVRIRLGRKLENRLVIPKSAVVVRSGKQVVFTFNDGKAMWNYVTTGLENFDSYEIVNGLEEGMTIIVSDNENLAHETSVILK